MDEFEKLLSQYRTAVERYVKFRLPSKADAEDVLQDVYLTAYQKFGQLKDKNAFQAWIVSIARNKCNDYFRSKAKFLEIPIDALAETVLTYGQRGVSVRSTVRETLDLLGDKDRQILYLYYWKELPQAQIAQRLSIPVGTVKSRLRTAKENFKEKYPYPPAKPKGEGFMTKLPEIMPDYTIEKSNEAPFPVKWEELLGWEIIPRLGEKLTWALYDFPSRKRTEVAELAVVGKAEVHGLQGVEIAAVQYGEEDLYSTGCIDKTERRFVAQLTDSHCRFLAESHVEDGVRKCYTFLDGDSFLNNWGFGPDNCGKETNMVCRNLLKREGNTLTSPAQPECMDIVGRYTVTINGKRYDTVCIVDVMCYDDFVATEQFVDRNGRTVLWRRFNRDDWAIQRFGQGQLWSEKLPDNERLYINGDTFVHWYDSISDYIL